MANGALLLVDAAEGPLPQTKFVLRKALVGHLKIILVVNKIDRTDARPLEVVCLVENLFLDIAHDETSLHFTTVYAVGRDGKAFTTLPSRYFSDTPGDLTPLFESILTVVPNSVVDTEKPYQMLISLLDYDEYVGKLAIGKVNRGTLKKGERIALTDEGQTVGTYTAQKLYTSLGLTRLEAEEVGAGDIVVLAGIPQMKIGQTVNDPEAAENLPKIRVEEPTIKINIGPNTSPLSGPEGKYMTSSELKERLLKEKETNIGLRIEPDSEGSKFSVAGRGELHLAILLETMRREGFELEVARPQVIYKTVDGKVQEPFEEVTIDVDPEFVGTITEELAARRGELINMHPIHGNLTRFDYKISSGNLLGLRNSLLTRTRGTAVINTFFIGYFPKDGETKSRRRGSLVAIKSGTSLSYGLENAQGRGVLFIGPGSPVYEGMVVGVSSRDFDIEVNVCKSKKLTNVRSENTDIAVQLTPPFLLTLETALDFVGPDELLKVTPNSIRLRKKILTGTMRKVALRTTTA